MSGCRRTELFLGVLALLSCSWSISFLFLGVLGLGVLSTLPNAVGTHWGGVFVPGRVCMAYAMPVLFVVWWDRCTCHCCDGGRCST
jgi:hypothetical protein